MAATAELSRWERVYLAVTSDDDGRICRDIPESACNHQPKNFFIHVMSLAATKTGDGLVDPKLVLSWLLGAIGAITVFAFGLALSLGVVEKSITAICGALVLGGLLWIAAALTFSALDEESGATEGGGNPLKVAIEQFRLLREDPQLVRFIFTRGLLIATALAPPYMLAMAGRDGGKSLGALGPFILASAFAAMSSTYIWGRLSDRSSRQVLALSGLVAATALGATAVLSIGDGGLLQTEFVPPALLFVLMVAYQGVRIGRSTHLVDMADRDRRAAYTALSNTIIGIVLLAGGLFGLIAQYAGEVAVIALFSAMCLGAAVVALGLKEVQD